MTLVPDNIDRIIFERVTPHTLVGVARLYDGNEVTSSIFCPHTRSYNDKAARSALASKLYLQVKEINAYVEQADG